MKIAIAYDKSNLDNERWKMVQSVSEALSKKYDAEPVAFEDNFCEKVKKYDAVFNLSTAYKQMHVPAILEVLKIPFTGSSAAAHALCIDKLKTKIILKHFGIPTPDFISVDLDEEVTEIDFYPAIVKPVKEGSAKGIYADSVVHNHEELKEKVLRVHKEFEQPALVEQFIEGDREYSIGIVGSKVLPILEIDFSSLPEGLERFYSHRVKHEYGEQTTYICPAQLTEELKAQIEHYALKSFKVLGLRNYARMDLRVKDGKIYFLEANSLPMLTPNYSDIIKMAQAAGYTYDEFILTIFEDALRK